MRGDNAVGVEIVKLLKRKVLENVKLFECPAVPVNFIL
jgi:Ni,Fe-hydrogenase maturation factor